MTTKKNIKKLVLFDAHAILHRAYHALPDFMSAGGEPTGGLYGVTTMLLKIIKDLKPDYMAACYDLPEPTFRKQVYAEYKAGRAKTDDALIAQMDRSRDIFKAFNIPIYDAPGFEADDVIGTIVEQVKEEDDLQTIIASGDMDTLQLVSKDKVLVYTLKKGLNDTILYNEKAVVDRFKFKPPFLVDYKGLRGDPSDNIIGIVGIGEKTATDLISNFGTIENIYKILEKDDAKILKAGIKPRIVNLLKEGEEEALFSKTLATIRRDAPIKFTLPIDVWQSHLEFSQIEKLFSELDFKSLSARAKNVVFGSSSEILDDSATEAVVDPKLFTEAQIALWVLDSEKTIPDLADIENYTGQKNLADAFEYLMKELEEKDLLKVYRDIELPLVPIIQSAQTRGILIDPDYFDSLSVKYHKELNKLSQEIYKEAGHEFNINSPKQLGVILFDELKLSVKGLKKTAGGARSTRESELIKLAEVHPIVDLILQQREIQKLVTTYIDVIPKLVDNQNRLHSKMNQTGASTGRMSSSDPNLQNIPADIDKGEEIRRGFVATPGHLFVAIDYSQIELRVLAILSRDHDLQEIFKTGKDVHSSVAARVFNVPEQEVTKDMRRKAKVINFGIIYGMGVNALKTNLGGTREEAQIFYDNYFATFPTIKAYFDNVISDAYLKGYTETLFGRRRYFQGLKSRLPFVRATAERGAMNAPLQGTAADIVKIAMIKAEDSLKKANLYNHCHLLLQIHDELIYEVETEYLDRAVEIIKKEMTQVLESDIPLDVGVEVGENWGNLQSFDI